MNRHAAFRAALLDPQTAPPGDLRRPGGGPAGKRFDVYRNNVVASLTEALDAAFPVLRALLGAEFFAAMAGVFLRVHPPGSPVLSGYGEAMPEFLAGFAPVAHLPYLPDIARIELACRRAYHAADVPPGGAARLRTLPPERLAAARLEFAPSVQALASEHPVHAIWQLANDPQAPRPRARAEAVLVTRPAFDPVVDPITHADARFLAACRMGEPLDRALAAGGGAFDLTPLLSRLLARNAITAVKEDPVP